IQALLRSRVALVQQQFEAVASTAKPLTEPFGEITAMVEETQQTLLHLLARADQDCVSVLFSGVMNAGKSSLLNALLGAVACPMGDQAATAGILTIATDPTATSSDCQLFVHPGPRDCPLEVGSIAVMRRKSQEINAVLRESSDAQVDSKESDLLLLMPRGSDGIDLEVTDSPGSNEALSPYINARWVSVLAKSDVVVIVVAYSQLEANDVAQLWHRFVSELPSQTTAQNLLVFINKYDQADPSSGFTSPAAKLEDTRRRCAKLILDYTHGKISLPTHQIFIGSARDALIGRIAMGLDSSLSDDVFHRDYAELRALAGHVFGGRRKKMPATVADLKELEAWPEVLEESGFQSFLDAFNVKARASVLTHMFKLVTTVEVATSRIHTTCANYAKQIDTLLSESTGGIERLQAAKEHVEAYFTKEADPKDAIYREEVKQALNVWLIESKAVVVEATEAVVPQFPTSFKADNERMLATMIAVFIAAAERAIRAASERYKASIASILDKRQQLVGSSFQEIQQVLKTFEVSLPSTLKPQKSTSEVEPKTEKAKSLAGMSEWVTNVVNLDTSQLTRDVKAAVRLKYEPGLVYKSEVDFSKPVNTRQVTGNYVTGHDHAKLGHMCSKVQVEFQVDAAFISHAFVLEIRHLTSYGGDTSRAPVTVNVNDHTVRKSFCPRAMHERDGNKVGVYHFVTDRWHLESSIIHEGKNVVTITYEMDGTTYYWFWLLGLHCSLPPTSTEIILTRDVKDIANAAIAKQLHLGPELDTLLTRMLEETSPVSALKKACEDYVAVLVDLAKKQVG
ncbi:hypothetical protein BBJ28_00026595, partial [Nothophytophthora sp. Chile5]